MEYWQMQKRWSVEKARAGETGKGMDVRRAKSWKQLKGWNI